MTDTLPNLADGDDVLVADRRATADVPTERACMACGEKFMSEGWHNRLCLRCRKRSEPDFV